MRQEMVGFWGAMASAGPYMQTNCTSLHTDNYTNTSSLNFYTGRTLFLAPNQQCQITNPQQIEVNGVTG